MSQPSLIIRIGADASGATREIHNTTQNIQNLGSQVNNTTNHVNHYNTIINQAANNSTNAANATHNLSGAVNGLKSAFAGVISLFGASQLMKQMDEWQSLEGRLKIVSNSYKELREAQVGLSQISQATRTDLAATTTLYFKLGMALKDVGIAQSELFRLTETTNKAIIISGAGAMEAKAALLQFGQAMASNRLGGDELRSMAEQTPRLVQAIREGLGMTQAEFKKAAENSEITTKAVTDSLASQAKKIDAEFRIMPLTIGQSFTLVGNAMTEFIGKSGQASGAAQGIADGVQFVATHLKELVQGLEIAVTSYAAYRLAAIASTLATEGFTIALLANPVGRTAALVGAAVGSLYAFKDSMVTVGNTTATVGGIVQAVFDDIKFTVNSVFNWIQNKAAQILASFNHVKNTIKGVQDAWSNVNFSGGFVDSLMSHAAQNDKQANAKRLEMEKNAQAEINGLKETEAEKSARIAKEAAKKSAQERLDFEKEFASESRKLQIKETEAIETWKKTYKRDLTKSELSDIHNSVYASEIKKAQAAQIKAAHKEETEAQRAAKKEQESYNRLIESTPIGEYRAKVEQLDSAYKKYIETQGKSGIDQETYNYLMVETADKYQKATVQTEKLTKAQKELNRAYEQTARGKFEKGMNELRLGKPNMSEGEYNLRQKEINDDYLKNTGHKDKIEDSEKLTKAYENEWEALQKIRRELTSTDREQFEYGLKKQKLVKSDIDKLMKEYDDVRKLTFIDDLGLSTRKLASSFSSMFSQVLTQGKSFTDALREMFKNMITNISAKLMDFGLNNLFSGNFLSGLLGMAGGVASGLMSSLFKDKIEDYRRQDSATSGTVLGGGSSNSIQNIVKTLSEIHAKEYKELQGINDNFGTLALAVDKTVAQAINLHGNFTPSTNGLTSTETGALKKQFLMGLGTTALSAGLAAAGVGTSLASTAVAGMINAATAVTGAASAVTQGLVGVSAALSGGGLAAAAAMGGIGLLVGGAIFGLGKLLGIGKTKYTAIGHGIVTNAIQYTAEGAMQAFTAYDYSTIQAKTKGWFSSKTQIYDVLNGVDVEMSKAFGAVFGSLHNSLKSVVDYLGLGDVINLNYTVPSLRIDLSKTKTDQEISDAIGKTINTMTDKIANETIGGLFSSYQKMGESILDTTGRLISQFSQVKGAFHKIGMELDVTGMAGVAFSDAINTVFESSVNAKDGMKNFTSSINDFYNTVLSKGEKTALSIKDYTKFADANPNLGLPNDPTKVTGEQLVGALNKVKTASEAAAQAEGDLAKHGQDVQNAFSPITANDLSSANAEWVKAWKAKIHASFDSMRPSDFDAGYFEIAQKWAGVNNDAGKFLAEIVRVATENEAKAQKGQAALSGTGITSKESFDTQLTDLKEATTASAAELRKVLSQTGAFNTIVNDFQKFYEDLNDTALAAFVTAGQAKEFARIKKYQELDDTYAINDKISPTVLADFKKANGDIQITTRSFAQYVDSVLDAKAANDEARDSINKVFDLTHTASEVSRATLQRRIDKLKEENTNTDMGNAVLQQRIGFLKAEWAAGVMKSYNDKKKQLAQELLNATATDSEKAANNLAFAIQDIKDNFVELYDAAGNAINPLQDLIAMTTELSNVEKYQAASNAMRDFGKSIRDWITNMNTSIIGNAKSQYETAQEKFLKNIATIKSADSSEADKTKAMTDMTGIADKYVATIEKYGAHGDWAQGQLKDVMSQMEGLGDYAKNIEQENNDYLRQIKDNTHDTAERLLLLAGESNTAIKDSTDANNSLAAALGSIQFSPVTIEPLTISLENVDGTKAILNEQLLTLNNIYAQLKLNAGSSAENDNSLISTPTKTTPTGGNVINFTLNGTGGGMPSYTNGNSGGFNSANQAASLGGTTPKKVSVLSGYMDTPAIPEGVTTSSVFSGYVIPDNSIPKGATASSVLSGYVIPDSSTNAANTPFYDQTYTASTQSIPQINSTNGSGANLNVVVNNNYTQPVYSEPEPNRSIYYDYSYGEYAALEDYARQSDFNRADSSIYFSAVQKQYLNSQYKKASYSPFSTGSGFVTPTVDGLERAKTMQYFAKGGVTNEPAIFGEAGWEAAVPLPDGRTIPVTIKQAPAQQQDFSEVIGVLVEGFGALLERIGVLEESLVIAQSKTTAATHQTGEKIAVNKTAYNLH